MTNNPENDGDKAREKTPETLDGFGEKTPETAGESKTESPEPVKSPDQSREKNARVADAKAGAAAAKEMEIDGEDRGEIPETMDPSKKSHARFMGLIFGISIILFLAAFFATFLVTSRKMSELEAGKDFYAIIPGDGYALSLDAVGRELALVPEGGSPPENFTPVDTVEVPVSRVAVASGQFDAGVMITLGMDESIIGVSTHPREWVSPEILRGFENNRITYLGLDNAIDYEALVALNPDLVFAPSVSSLTILDELKLPSSATYTNVDNSLKARFAFLTWLSALGGKEEPAKAWLEDYEKTIKELRLKVKDLPPTKTLWAVIFEKRVFVEPGNNWVGESVSNAGGEYLFKDLPGDSTIEVSLEKFVESGREADVLFLYPGFADYAKSKADLIKYNENLASLKPLGPNGRTYMTRPIFYESFGRLGEICEELAAILHPEAFPPREPVFFREIP
ncbi:MAG: ABC transporter substrate-binding protein [Deltaproteobacteria bacterium]|nr:ABC transporter substrate-binding protein [Deltaproteobacteria bacterium]